MRSFAALLLLCLPNLAFAQDLTWRWNEHDVLSYRIQTYMQFRSGEVRLYAGRNIDARIENLTLGIETDCKSVSMTRRTQALECTIRRAEIGIGSRPQHQDNAELIAREYADLLAVSTVQVELSRQGRIKTIDLEGIPKDTDREGARHELLRMIVARAFGALEIELPKDGDHRGEPWVQGGLPLVMRLPVTAGTVGKAKVHHSVESHVDDIVSILSQGEASAQSGRELELAKAGLGAARVVQTVWIGTSRFDERRGILLSNDYRIDGTLTAAGNAGGSDYYMTQVGMVELIEDWEAEAAANKMAEDEARALKEAEAAATRAAEESEVKGPAVEAE